MTGEVPHHLVNIPIYFDFDNDPRPVCDISESSNLYELAVEKYGLFCVDPTENCETTRFQNERCLDNIFNSVMVPFEEQKVCFSFSVVFYAILVSIPIQFLVELLIVYTTITHTDSIQDFGMNTLKCSLQWMLAVVVFSVGLYGASKSVHCVAKGRPEMAYFTWFLVVVLDQIRNVVMQVIIWYILLRRCGQTPVLDEKEAYAEEEIDSQVRSPWEVFRSLIGII